MNYSHILSIEVIQKNSLHNDILRAKEKGPIARDNRKSEGTARVIKCVINLNPRNTNIFPVVIPCEQLFLRNSSKMKSVLDKKTSMESISLNSFVLLEHLAMLLTSTLAINC